MAIVPHHLREGSGAGFQLARLVSRVCMAGLVSRVCPIIIIIIIISVQWTVTGWRDHYICGGPLQRDSTTLGVATITLLNQ